MEFSEFFTRATGFTPYPYQSRLAQATRLPTLLTAPTGVGKTEAAVLSAWLWRRRYHASEAVRRAVPRRLVYCLPMRTLVEQTHQRVSLCLERLGISEEIPVTMLMGGEGAREWFLHPEIDQVLIGTQDMLISRALNRGYAASPFRWPWEFGLLNNDCLWVMDEVQLMGSALPTSTQLQAFREQLGTAAPTETIWMSATVRADWLSTVDFNAPAGDEILTLGPEDGDSTALRRRNEAVKTTRALELPTPGSSYRPRELAGAVLKMHLPESTTLIVLNTVARAQQLYDALLKQSPKAELILVHSRFRPAERRAINERLTATEGQPSDGRIVVATQAIEAGLDFSARTLITELAPWPSMVQRFGRCNRRGEYDVASVFWLDLADKDAPPYEPIDLAHARELLISLEGGSASPAKLPQVSDQFSYQAVLRRRDLLGLFDTSADLSGSYIDVSRFVRGEVDTDVSVFWRDWQGDTPPANLATASYEELCSVPVRDMRDYLDKKRPSRAARVEAEDDDEEAAAESGDDEDEDEDEATHTNSRVDRMRQAWRWNHTIGQWERLGTYDIHAGMTVLLSSQAGGYRPDRGWDRASGLAVPTAASAATAMRQDHVSDESSNTDLTIWVPLQDHSQRVHDEISRILDELENADLKQEIADALTIAARYHDVGKAHPVFQQTLLSNLEADEQEERAGVLWAKRGKSSRSASRHSRPYFRHEVASAIALLSLDIGLRGRYADLSAYLAAAHHGKVRLAMRSLPRSREQTPDERYLLLGFPVPYGDGGPGTGRAQEVLPRTDLGQGVTTAEVPIDLSLARVGVSPDGEYSWLERTLGLLDWIGPFRLAYLEALLRAADVLASKAEQEGGRSQ